MIKSSIPGIRGEGTEHSSRHLVCTKEYCATLAHDYAIAERDVKDVFEGEPMKRALRVCEWVETTDAKSPRERGEVLVRWARKNGSGVYRRSQGPEGGPTVTPQSKERVRFSPEQIAKNLDRMGA